MHAPYFLVSPGMRRGLDRDAEIRGRMEILLAIEIDSRRGDLRRILATLNWNSARTGLGEAAAARLIGLRWS